jgi:hypothetical protein
MISTYGAETGVLRTPETALTRGNNPASGTEFFIPNRRFSFRPKVCFRHEMAISGLKGLAS